MGSQRDGTTAPVAEHELTGSLSLQVDEPEVAARAGGVGVIPDAPHSAAPRKYIAA